MKEWKWVLIVKMDNGVKIVRKFDSVKIALEAIHYYTTEPGSFMGPIKFTIERMCFDGD